MKLDGVIVLSTFLFLSFALSALGFSFSLSLFLFFFFSQSVFLFYFLVSYNSHRKEQTSVSSTKKRKKMERKRRISRILIWCALIAFYSISNTHSSRLFYIYYVHLRNSKDSRAQIRLSAIYTTKKKFPFVISIYIWNLRHAKKKNVEKTFSFSEKRKLVKLKSLFRCIKCVMAPEKRF